MTITHKISFLILTALCLTAAAAEQPVLDDVIQRQARVGRQLIHEDFSTVADGALPAGWVKDFPHPFLWKAAQSTGLTGQNVAVKDHRLHETVNTGSHILTLPPLHTSHYLITVTFRFLRPTGSFGIVTDLADDLAQSSFGTNSMMYPYEEPLGELAQFIRAKGDINRVNIDAANGYFPGKLPQLDTDIVFTVCHLNNVTWFFCNGKFVSQLADYNLNARNRAHDTQPRTRVGLYALGGHVTVSAVTITELLPKTLFERNMTNALSLGRAAVCLQDQPATGDLRGLCIPLTLDKTDRDLRPFVECPDCQLGLIAMPVTDTAAPALMLKTPGVINATVRKATSPDASRLTAEAFLPTLSPDALGRTLLLRPYIRITTPDGPRVLYAASQQRCCPAVIANQSYAQLPPREQQQLDAMFAGVKGYQGARARRLTFCIFSDFHYKKGMYAGRICDLQGILDRAHAAHAQAVLHGGDCCNDYIHSRELTYCLLDNTHGLPVFGVYGNHELEARGNTMQKVTPLITNRADTVVWGTPDGSIGDGSIAYYHVDINGFRLICTDTNYAWDPKQKTWLHNLEASHGPPAGTTSGNSLGPQQLAWLERVVMDAAANGIPCIVLGHDSFSNLWGSSPDTKAVQAIYRQANTLRPGTILMSINGHYHQSKVQVKDNILYWNVNTTFNGQWLGGQKTHHYADDMTYLFDDFDAEGNPLGTRTRRLNELGQAKNTWFFDSPLSAIATIDSTGLVTIEGGQTTWRYGVVPPPSPGYERNLSIPSGNFNLFE